MLICPISPQPFTKGEQFRVWFSENTWILLLFNEKAEVQAGVVVGDIAIMHSFNQETRIDNQSIHALHAYRLCLCFKIDRGNLTVSQSTEIFENLRSALNDAKEIKGEKEFQGNIMRWIFARGIYFSNFFKKKYVIMRCSKSICHPVNRLLCRYYYF